MFSEALARFSLMPKGDSFMSDGYRSHGQAVLSIETITVKQQGSQGGSQAVVLPHPRCGPMQPHMPVGEHVQVLIVSSPNVSCHRYPLPQAGVEDQELPTLQAFV